MGERLINILKIHAQPTADSPSQDITINAKNIDFVVKPPLEQWLISMPSATFRVDSLNKFLLLDAGLVELDTPDGNKCYVNPKSLLGWTQLELSEFIIVFPGSRCVVKATTAELEREFGVRVYLDP